MVVVISALAIVGGGVQHLDRRGAAPAVPARTSHGTATPSMTTGPRVGLSSVAWDTPAGVITSTAFGTAPGSTEQMGLVLPVAHTANDQPDVGVPNAASGSPIVIVLLTCDAPTNAVPSELPEASCQIGDANPCTSTISLHALAGAMV